MHLSQVGLQHPRVKLLRAVLRASSSRDRHLLVAEGLWAHERLLELGTPIEVFLWCPEAATSVAHRRSRQVAQRAAHAYQVSARVLARLTERDQPDGMVSLVRLPTWHPAAVPLRDRAVVLVADAIEIPGNLGTLLRSLDACGGDCLLLTNRRTRLSHPLVFRASRGMSLRVPVLEFGDPAAAIDWLSGRGFAIHLATTGPEAVPYHRVSFPHRTALVVGNERHGLSGPWHGHGFAEVSVPMLGAADSLNVGACASVLLYAVRARLAGW